MSVALVLAGVETFSRFRYIGGEQREKGGLGIVLDGRERVVYQDNPWSRLAVREVERARDMWAHGLFEGAASVLRKTAPRSPRPLRFNAIADLAMAAAARHRLAFKDAIGKLGGVRGRIPLLFDGMDVPDLVSCVETAMELCRDCGKQESSPILLRELLDNALRTAAQARYEDAAARLYRAMEMQIQIWLFEVTNGAFVNGKLKKGKQLPPALSCLRDEFGDGEIKLSMEQGISALAKMGHADAKSILSRIHEWRRGTEERNAGILGHGTKSIGEEGFKRIKQVAAEFLRFDLSSEINPIPALNPDWL
jgi:CRISPR-associated protein (TIGR02710 family)